MNAKKLLLTVLISLNVVSVSSASDQTLWYRQPASDTADQPAPAGKSQPPVGNGRLGGFIAGETARERVVVNEDSLWTGGENPSGNYDTMGAYQVFGDVFVNLTGHTNAANYRRDLDIGDALSHVNYEVGGVKFQREFFCSHPAGVLVARFTTGKHGGYTGSIEMDDSHRAQTVVSENRLTVSGKLDNGLKYEWQLLVLNDGGTLTSTKGAIGFKNCDSLTLLIDAGTDYAMDFAKNYRGEDPHSRLTAQLDAAARKNYKALKAEHEKDFHLLFNRVAVDFGKSSAAQRALPTDQRKLEAFKTAFSVWPLPADFLFAAGRFAGEFAGTLERPQQPAVAF